MSGSLDRVPVRSARALATAGLMAISIALAPIVVAQTPPDTLPKRSGLAGVVRDTLGRPLRQATVHATGKDLLVVTDDSGRFHIGGIVPGPVEFTVMRIGFRMVTFTVDLPPDSTVIVALNLREIEALETVVVRDSVTPRLARSGFYDRRRTGLGTFLTPQRLDSLSHTVTRPAQFLRDVPGLEVRCTLSTCTVTSRWSNCLWLYVDGVAHGTDQLDNVALTPSGIHAIEVYDRSARVPTRFQGRPQGAPGQVTGSSGCGAIVVWTFSRAG